MQVRPMDLVSELIIATGTVHDPGHINSSTWFVCVVEDPWNIRHVCWILRLASSLVSPRRRNAATNYMWLRWRMGRSWVSSKSPRDAALQGSFARTGTLGQGRPWLACIMLYKRVPQSVLHSQLAAPHLTTPHPTPA